MEKIHCSCGSYDVSEYSVIVYCPFCGKRVTTNLEIDGSDTVISMLQLRKELDPDAPDAVVIARQQASDQHHD